MNNLLLVKKSDIWSDEIEKSSILKTIGQYYHTSHLYWKLVKQLFFVKQEAAIF